MTTPRGLGAYTRALAKAKADLAAATKSRDDLQEKVDQTSAIVDGLEQFVKLATAALTPK